MTARIRSVEQSLRLVACRSSRWHGALGPVLGDK